MSSTATTKKEPPTSSENLDAYKQQALRDFNRAQETLYEKTEVARKQYLDPAQDFIVDQAQTRPILTCLLGIFFALSFFPILTFVLFSAGAILTVVTTALVISLVTLGIVLGIALTLLVGTLFVTAFLSLCGIGWILALYSVVRLGQNILNNPSIVEGLKAFDLEMRALFFGRKQQSTRTSSTNSNGKNVSFSE